MKKLRDKDLVARLVSTALQYKTEDLDKNKQIFFLANNIFGNNLQRHIYYVQNNTLANCDLYLYIYILLMEFYELQF